MKKQIVASIMLTVLSSAAYALSVQPVVTQPTITVVPVKVQATLPMHKTYDNGTYNPQLGNQ